MSNSDTPTSGHATPEMPAEAKKPSPGATDARRRLWLRSGLEVILDFIWPTALPPTKDEIEDAKTYKENRQAKEKAALDALDLSDRPTLHVAAERIEKLADSEDERRKGIETRLASVLALSSITTAITFGIFSGVFEKGLALASEWLGRAVLVILAYVGLQLVHATGAAVVGLRRRTYSELEPVDLLPEPGESPPAATKRIATLRLDCFFDAQEKNNGKVTQMEVAHVSLRNSFAGLTGLILLMLVTTFGGRVGKTLEARVMEKLRADSELLERLRGAPGTTGPQGPQGERGADGQACVCPTPPSAARERRR
jgi:hypothetical protein